MRNLDGRRSKGTRLYLRDAKRPGGARRWVILDTTSTGERIERSTGAFEGDRTAAEIKLAAYIAEHPQPCASPALIGVYLLMRKGRAVYVGSSLDMPNRVAGHRRNGRPFDQVFYIVTKAEQRKHLEAILIRAIKPAQNKTLPTKETAVLVEVSAVLASVINGIAPAILSPHEDTDTHADL